MWGWVTAMAALLTSVLLLDVQLRGERSVFRRVAVSAAVGTGAFFLLSVLWPKGAFPAALLAGQSAYLVGDILRRRQVLAGGCLCVGFDLAFLPLCLGGEEVWEYGVYLAALSLCAVLAAANADREPSGSLEADLSVMEHIPRLLVSCIPCGVLLPELVLLTNIAVSGGAFTVPAVLLSSVQLLAVYLLLLLLQRERGRRLTLEVMNGAMDQWQRDSRDYMNTIRSQRHDLNLHMNAISGLLKSGSYEKCQNYVKRLVVEVNAINDIMPLSDAVVGSMLLNMREEARRRGSDIKYHITYDMRDILCSGFECNKIIGNLLQNAIDALETPEDKADGIRLRIFKRRGNTVISVENRFTGDMDRIARVFEPGFSTKKNHEGIGLSMVLRTVQRYGGTVYPVFKADTIRFVVNIPNKLGLAEQGEDLDENSDIDP